MSNLVKSSNYPDQSTKNMQDLFDEDHPSSTFRALHDKFEAVFWKGVDRNRKLTEQDQDDNSAEKPVSAVTKE